MNSNQLNDFNIDHVNISVPITFLYEGAPKSFPSWTHLRVKATLRRVLRRQIQKEVRGPAAVRNNLFEGLRRINCHFMDAPPKNLVTHWVGVLSDAEQSLAWAVKAKRKGVIDKLCAGPNLVIIPDWHDFILCDPAIDLVIVPSNYIADIYLDRAPSLDGRVVVWPVGVDTKYWKPGQEPVEFDLLIYEKYQEPGSEEMSAPIKEALAKKGISSTTVRYGEFTHSEYRSYLNKCRGMIYLSELESQGISLFESWSTGVPTLVWDREKWIHKDISYPGSSAPYLSEKCGMKFRNIQEFPAKLDEFIEHINFFEPREYIIESYTLEKSAESYVNLFLR